MRNLPPSILTTTNPDSNPPILDLNWITVTAEPTNPVEPNGETRVDITFRIKDDISGYSQTFIDLRDPHGVVHTFSHLHSDYYKTYFTEDPSVFKIYHKTIILPVGSVPGTWGISQMTVQDKAQNILLADFTEIVRFVVDDMSVLSRYDVNGDGKINILDLIMVANSFGESENDSADVNGDGTVNIQDLVGVASHFGEGSVAAPTAHNLTEDQIQSWITQAMEIDDSSPAFQTGLRVLRNFLLTLRPEKTELLPNFPNPFNPETWIPYQLAEPSAITLTISNLHGVVVREMNLGHQPAGRYITRGQAIYWDGRNNIGEKVATGVYFYTLDAGDYSATRKMLIVK